MGTAASKRTQPAASPRPFRIAIVGGGIGGLSTALFIQHFCSGVGTRKVAIDVYEQGEEYREQGAGIGIGVNATKLYERIGVVDQVNEIAAKREDNVFFTIRRVDNGDEIKTILTAGSEQGKAKFSSVSRAELLQVLLDAVKGRDAARLHTRKKCRGLEDLGDCVNIAFEDGTSAEADLVIGSDGIHSAVRQQFVKDRAVYSGKLIYRGLIPMSSLPEPWPLPSRSVIWMGPGRHIVTYPISSNKTLNFIGCVSKNETELAGLLRESWSATCDLEEVQDAFAGCDELLQKLISLIPGKPSKWLLNDRDPVADWTFFGGKVALLGDAAHPMTPHQSAGCGQAVEDGYIIGKALSDFLGQSGGGKDELVDLGRWMRLYQTVRVPRAKKVQETSRDAGLVFHLQTPELRNMTFEESIPIAAKSLSERFKWIWTEDLDVAYERGKTDMLAEAPAPGASERSLWTSCRCM